MSNALSVVFDAIQCVGQIHALLHCNGLVQIIKHFYILSKNDYCNNYLKE